MKPRSRNHLTYDWNPPQRHPSAAAICQGQVSLDFNQSYRSMSTRSIGGGGGGVKLMKMSQSFGSYWVWVNSNSRNCKWGCCFGSLRARRGGGVVVTTGSIPVLLLSGVSGAVIEMKRLPKQFDIPARRLDGNWSSVYVRRVPVNWESTAMQVSTDPKVRSGNQIGFGTWWCDWLGMGVENRAWRLNWTFRFWIESYRIEWFESSVMKQSISNQLNWNFACF